MSIIDNNRTLSLFARRSNDPTIMLNHDLLWHVFSLNADMEHESEDDPPAITTLRHTSQVCTTWRNLIITSPSLWSRVLDFGCLRKENWRNEVIRRTGGSDLFVRGNRHGLQGMEKIVVHILEENWPRVRSLNLDFNWFGPKIFKHNSNLWRLLQRPANIMQSFQLSLRVGDGFNESPQAPILSPPGFKIFDNHAPLLVTFIAPNIQFDLRRAPWTSHIRRLALNTPVSVHELLEALTYMPFLETLEDQKCWVIGRGGATRMQSLREVALPRLQEIIIITPLDITPYMAFLSHIQPADGRLLVFWSLAYSPENCRLEVPVATAALNVLSIYSRHAELAASTKIALVVATYVFRFQASLPTGKSFVFSIDCDVDLPDELPVKTFLTTLNIPKFYHARTLNLRIDLDCDIPPSHPKFMGFFASVASIEVLQVNKAETLQFLIGLPNDLFKVTFPILQKIEVDELVYLDEVAPIHAFLVLRMVAEKPISTLSIRFGYGPYGEMDLGLLENITGLKVVFVVYGKDDREYICGSRRPEELLEVGQADLSV